MQSENVYKQINIDININIKSKYRHRLKKQRNKEYLAIDIDIDIFSIYLYICILYTPFYLIKSLCVYVYAYKGVLLLELSTLCAQQPAG